MKPETHIYLFFLALSTIRPDIAAFSQQFFLSVKWIDDGVWNIHTFFAMKNLISDAFLGVVNANATNVLGKGQYFVDRSGCIEKLYSKLKLEWKRYIALIHCRPHILSEWYWRSQWWRSGSEERRDNTAKYKPIHHTHINAALIFGKKFATEC